MHMINTIYFTYLSGTVCRDRYQHQNERKLSHDGHFIVFVLQKIIEIPVLAPNICMFHHITSLYESVPRHIHTIIILLIVDNNILKWHKNTHQIWKYINLFISLNAELNPICYLLALLAHHFLRVSRIGVKSLTLRLLMSYIYIYIYIYGAPILDVSRSHTTTQHSR